LFHLFILLSYFIMERNTLTSPRRSAILRAEDISMAKKALVLLAGGFEELEAITPVDYLRRAGVEVTVAAIGASLTVMGSHSIPVTADATLAVLAGNERAALVWDAVIVPGGGTGAANLAASTETGALLREMAAAGKWVCAICASPAVVLAPLGIIAGKRFTCYPGLEKDALAHGAAAGARWSEDRVVIDGTVITSRGAGTAGEFAVAIAGRLAGERAAGDLARSVLLFKT
jgi:4-methyl-5(b-hydroxyethyl)-thiazole monophosphate biosynthesis